jgi:hypothetical protein
MDASASNPSRRVTSSGTERPSSYDSSRISFQAVNESERGIWRHFESYKRSAILHAEQYLRYSAVRKHDPESLVHAELSGSDEYNLSIISSHLRRILTFNKWLHMLNKNLQQTGVDTVRNKQIKYASYEDPLTYLSRG